MNSRAYCSWFNFKGSDQQKKVKDLSGGERNRVHLARLAEGGRQPASCSTSRPTISTSRRSRRSRTRCSASRAASVVVSHDRWFLDRIATHILAFEGDGKVTFFDGNYQTYEEDRKKRLGDDGEKGPKGKFRKLQ